MPEAEGEGGRSPWAGSRVVGDNICRNPPFTTSALGKAPAVPSLRQDAKILNPLAALTPALAVSRTYSMSVRRNCSRRGSSVRHGAGCRSGV